MIGIVRNKRINHIHMKINDIWTVHVEIETKLCVFKYLPDYYRSARISLEI